jgi:threonine dehydrogenase-like Zn-dependent dehydrogenase
VHCDASRPSLCAARADIAGEDGPDGAFAEYVRVHESQLLRLPEGLSLRVAALAEPLAVALHALTRGGISEGGVAQRALVTGAGPLGLLIVAALAARGVQEIRVSEPAAGRRERAARVGATETCTPGDLVAPVMPYALVDDPVDVAFECSGHPEAMEGALGQLGRAGTLVLVGTGMKRPRLDHNRILLNELVVTGAYTYDEDGMADAIALLGSGRLPTDWLIEPQDVPLEGMLAAMERLATGEIPAKVMVIPGTR